LLWPPLCRCWFFTGRSAEQLVIRTLDDAHDSIRLMGYSFTSPDVVKSLVAAKRRGVDVRVVVDEKVTSAKPARPR
jgi:phosphatidylserine/phosphatidylglycerophosphate/cardiolipin synthase-like enzyme